MILINCLTKIILFNVFRFVFEWNESQMETAPKRVKKVKKIKLFKINNKINNKFSILSFSLGNTTLKNKELAHVKQKNEFLKLF